MSCVEYRNSLGEAVKGHNQRSYLEPTWHGTFGKPQGVIRKRRRTARGVSRFRHARDVAVGIIVGAACGRVTPRLVMC